MTDEQQRLFDIYDEAHKANLACQGPAEEQDRLAQIAWDAYQAFMASIEPAGPPA